MCASHQIFKLKPKKDIYPYDYDEGNNFEVVNESLLQNKFPSRKSFNTRIKQGKILWESRA